MRCLVTGGAGYVVSTTARALAAAGHDVTIADDLSAGHRAAVAGLPLVEADLTTADGAQAAVAAGPFDAVLHFVGLISVRESFDQPERYFGVNLGATERVLEAMRAAGVRRMIFSSTAAVYGDPATVPIPESAPIQPTSPYGDSKAQVETALAAAAAEWGLGSVALRYFNASGAESAEHGEDHSPEEHLIPRVLAFAASGEAININGTDYPTPDGTAVRDYIHVSDLAAAHVAALGAVTEGALLPLNVGSGSGYSVKQIVDAAEQAVGRPINRVEAPRRKGDPPTLIADTTAIRDRLGWAPAHDITRILADAWAWHSSHPNGYGDR
jgi:UDP-glucose 4-epimerase